MSGQEEALLVTIAQQQARIEELESEYKPWPEGAVLTIEQLQQALAAERERGDFYVLEATRIGGLLQAEREKSARLEREK